MTFAIIMLVASLAMILLASLLFTNGIELLGHRLNMHQGTVGSVLAAVGTAMPETIIPLIAILVFRDEKSIEVGIGAIAGAPFMLATLAFFVTGAAVLVYALLGKRSLTMHVDAKGLARDLGFFVVLYGAAVAVSFVHELFWVKAGVAMVLLLSYGGYVRATLKSEAAEMEVPERLLIGRIFPVRGGMFWVVVQVAASLGLMIVSADWFVSYAGDVSVAAGVSPLVLSLIITPIATELPEKFNSVIWVGKKKDILALGNITGAMVFQSSFPVAFGIAFTSWDLSQGSGVTLVSALLAFVSALIVLAWATLRKSLNPFILMSGGLMYGVFIWFISTHNLTAFAVP